MKVLMIGQMDFASVGYELKQALRRNGHEALVVTQEPQRWGLPTDRVAGYNIDREEYKQYLKDCDMVLNISGFHSYLPFNIPIPAGKVRALWNGGTNYRQNAKEYHDRVFPRFNVCYAHWDLAGLHTKNNLLQQPIDCYRYKYMRRASFGKKLAIGHIPSSREKGSNVFINAMTDLEQEYDFAWTVAENMNHSDVMREKRKFHIYFDQILNQPIPFGAHAPYGVALIESACYGSVCLCGAEAPGTWPIGKVYTEEDIKRAVLPFLAGDFDLWSELSELTRAWVERLHSYDAVYNQFMKPLEGLF